MTRSTFFRHFSDKREVLVAGQETLARLLAEGIAEAPASGPKAPPTRRDSHHALNALSDLQAATASLS